MPIKPDMIPEDTWKIKMQELHGDQGYMVQKNYYKTGQYRGEINTGNEIGFEVYNPVDSLHYSWQLNAESAIVRNKNKSPFIRVKEIIDLETIDTIGKIPCKMLEVRLSIGKYTVWYNKDYFKFQANAYKGSIFSNEVVEKIGCLPIKIELKGMMSVELMDYENQKVAEDKFVIPEFKELIKGMD